MALQLSEDRLSMMDRRQQIIEGLHALPSQIKTVLEGDRKFQQLASGVLANQRSLLIMGRGYQYVVFRVATNALCSSCFYQSGMLRVWKAPSRSRKSRTCTLRVFWLES